MSSVARGGRLSVGQPVAAHRRRRTAIPPHAGAAIPPHACGTGALRELTGVRASALSCCDWGSLDRHRPLDGGEPRAGVHSTRPHMHAVSLYEYLAIHRQAHLAITGPSLGHQAG